MGRERQRVGSIPAVRLPEADIPRQEPAVEAMR